MPEDLQTAIHKASVGRAWQCLPSLLTGHGDDSHTELVLMAPAGQEECGGGCQMDQQLAEQWGRQQWRSQQWQLKWGFRIEDNLCRQLQCKLKWVVSLLQGERTGDFFLRYYMQLL